MAPRSPRTCGIAPERHPRMAATTTSRSVTASMGFTARSSHRPAEAALAPRPGRWSGDRDLDRCRSAGRVADGVGPWRELAELDDGPLGFGDLDADNIPSATALAQGDGERLGVGTDCDDDRIEDVAGFDATRVG